MNLEEYVEDLFKRQFHGISRRTGTYPSQRNPVDDGVFLLGLDPLRPQRRRAVAALEALSEFALTAPAHLQPLPLTFAARELRKGRFDEHHLVGLFARSWACTGYDPNHPSFQRYASGVLALPQTGALFLEHHPELAAKYPPLALPGLDEGTHVTLLRRAKRKRP
jgi:hypothetical protein